MKMSSFSAFFTPLYIPTSRSKKILMKTKMIQIQIIKITFTFFKLGVKLQNFYNVNGYLCKTELSIQ